MKILSATAGLTTEAAMWERISKIIDLLRSGGHEVNVVHYVLRSASQEIKNDKRKEQDSFVIVSMLTVHIKHLKKLLSNKYDLVYGNLDNAVFCSLLGKLTKTPLIFDMHGGLVEEFLLEKGTNLRTKISPMFFLNKIVNFMDLKFSDRIICVSKKMIEYLHNEKGIPLEKMVYVTNGVDLNFLKPVNDDKVKNMRNKLELRDKLVFGYIGNFQYWQGVENFIDAARKIDDKEKEIAFLIVGGERESKERNIIFIPKVPRAQTPAYYAICDILVLPRPSYPATEIAAPTKFAEYVAIGKPILTTNVGDAAEFVREYKCGIVVEDNKVENLIKGMNEFKDKSGDELKIMAENSRKLAENEFDWEKVGINLLKAIEQFQ